MVRTSVSQIPLGPFEPFNVEEEWESYVDVVKKWRARLTFETIHVLGVEKPVLPPQEDSQLIEIVLRTSIHSITLKIRTFDLYVVGYKNGEEQWFEFQPEGAEEDSKRKQKIEKLIGGSTLLPYSCSYSAIEDNADSDRSSVQLRRQQLMVAIANLTVEPKKVEPSKKGKKVKIDRSYEEKRAHALLTIVLMVPEAIRFDTMLHYASSNLTWNNNYTPLLWKVTLTNSWQTLCRIIAKAFNENKHDFGAIIFQEIPYTVTVKTIEDASKAVAMLKDEGLIKKSKQLGSSRSRKGNNVWSNLLLCYGLY